MISFNKDNSNIKVPKVDAGSWKEGPTASFNIGRNRPV